MTFTEAISTNPPRLVVMHRHNEDDTDNFQWGIMGSVPILTLIGAAALVQTELASKPQCTASPCTEQALVILWSSVDGTMQWYVHQDIPLLPLIGMLETIKGALLMSRMGQRIASQQTQVLGPDGSPMRR